MKKVIFVSGTSYSGSTLLDMVLANNKKAFRVLLHQKWDKY